jgi:hypothetical protein
MNFSKLGLPTLSIIQTSSLAGMALLSSFSLPCHSAEVDKRRSEIFNEVRTMIHDDELARQITEIRLKREKFSSISAKQTFIAANSTTERNINTPVKIIEPKHHDTTPMRNEDRFNYPSGHGFHAGIGNRIAIGYSEKTTNYLAVRAEVSGLNTFQQSKNVNDTKEMNLSLGAYLDWFPTDSSFRLSAGVNINRMRTTLNGISGSNVNINGKQVSLGSNVYNVEFKFPTVTPYVGIGFGDFHNSDAGLHVYGDFGLMLGKYDAIAKTSVVGNQGVTTSDVDAELNHLRKSLYKWNFIPTATVGLTYRFN